MSISDAENKVRLFSEYLLRFAESNLRDFPWRDEKDVFRILIAELLLQKSRSSTVAEVYIDFIKHWKDAVALSEAAVEEIEDVIRPLGLIGRAHRLSLLAKELVRFGEVPQTHKELMTLPGVGLYIASTTAAVAFGSHELAIDSVSSRVYRRYFGQANLEEDRDTIKSIIDTIKNYTPKGKIHIFNWAILDLSSIICLPKLPRCEECMLKASCSWAQAL